MEAHEVRRGTKVTVMDDNVRVPVGSTPINKGDEITILALDAMYCNGKDKDGNKVYIAAWTNVEPCL